MMTFHIQNSKVQITNVIFVDFVLVFEVLMFVWSFEYNVSEKFFVWAQIT